MLLDSSRDKASQRQTLVEAKFQKSAAGPFTGFLFPANAFPRKGAIVFFIGQLSLLRNRWVCNSNKLLIYSETRQQKTKDFRASLKCKVLHPQLEIIPCSVFQYSFQSYDSPVKTVCSRVFLNLWKKNNAAL